MKSAIPYAFAAQLQTAAIRDGYRNPPEQPAEPEAAAPRRRARFLRSLALAR